jgi:glycerophosphoryl diester phosphodiesterase
MLTKKIKPMRILFCLFFSLWACSLTKKTINMPTTIDWQGHRGCRGLMPENTVAAFEAALRFEAIKTLEMDVCVSKDGQIFVSHEPWFSHEISTKPNGDTVSKKEEMSLNTFQMNYEDIIKYDVGKKVHQRFLGQQKIAATKPLLSEVVEAVNQFCKQNNRPLPRYNIEIKSDERGDNLFHPTPDIFVKKVLDEVKNLGIYDQTCLQSFDNRCLNALRKLDKKIIVAQLVENIYGVEKNLQKLDFQPNIYSCNYKLLYPKTIDSCHAKGIKVIPWTVNTTEEMSKLLEMQVDGIITDYPNLIPKI